MNKLKILIADNDEDEIFFAREGFEASNLFEIVAIAESGEDVMKLLDELQSNHLPDLILSDLNMPGRNGYDLLHDLKNHPSFSHIPVFISSTSSTQSSISKCMQLGATSYLIKPETFTRYVAFAQDLYNRYQQIHSS